MINASIMNGGIINGTEINGVKINGVQINGGNINVDTDIKVGDSITIGNPESFGNKELNFDNQGNPVAKITKYTNGELKVWCDNKITLAGYGGTSIVGQVGFFSTQPTFQQETSKLDSSASLEEVIDKVNEVIDILKDYGLVRIAR